MTKYAVFYDGCDGILLDSKAEVEENLLGGIEENGDLYEGTEVYELGAKSTPTVTTTVKLSFTKDTETSKKKKGK